MIETRAVSKNGLQNAADKKQPKKQQGNFIYWPDTVSKVQSVDSQARR